MADERRGAGRPRCGARLLPHHGGLRADAAADVLLLYDERVELPGLAALDASITESLTAGSPDGVEIYRESLDLSRFGTAEHLQRFREYLRTKYRGARVDLAIAAMEPSLQFLLAYGAEILPGTPIVFCGIDMGDLAHIRPPPGMTGIVVKRGFASTVELALRLQPSTRHVLVVAGTSAFDSLLLQQARAEFRKFEDRLGFEYLTDLSLRDAMERVSRLTPDTIVLFTTMFRDGAGPAARPARSHPVHRRVGKRSGLWLSRPIPRTRHRRRRPVQPGRARQPGGRGGPAGPAGRGSGADRPLGVDVEPAHVRRAPVAPVEARRRARFRLGQRSSTASSRSGVSTAPMSPRRPPSFCCRQRPSPPWCFSAGAGVAPRWKCRRGAPSLRMRRDWPPWDS